MRARGAGSDVQSQDVEVGLRQQFSAFVVDCISDTGVPRRPDLKKGLAVTAETVYVDGAVGEMPGEIGEHDVKVVYETEDGFVFGDYAAGFSVARAADMTADLSLSPKYVAFRSADAKIVISKEWAVGEETPDYLAFYFYRFLLSNEYRAANNIELLNHTGTDDYETLTVRLGGFSGDFDTYTYIDFKTGTRNFYHVMLKYSSGNPNAEGLTQRVLDSFRYFRPEGAAVYTTDYGPELPESWTDETRALYEQIAASDSVLWGIFTKNVSTNGINSEIPDIEEKLDYKFDIILNYTGLDGGFPTEFMEQCASEGRIVEMTLQATVSNNLDLYGPSPWLELYRTGDDARIREFARAATAFGKPFLFRLNNEMNSDWVSYGGVTNMLDPDIYIANWRTVYRIFEEEGVTNAIWIFNPNDRDAPPNGWNCQAAYYPGNGYVHMLGVTGYNNGTYYQELWGENWREFQEIYDKVQADSGELFGAFPWIITEFSSSSVGGDKAKWIDGMFENLWRYPNIKAAVWFSYADFDIKDGVTPARPYWLDETDATIAAFRRGLEGLGKTASPG
jgi:hypothetical protein